MSSDTESELLDPSKWSAADEVHLLFSTLDHKPVGIDKHIQMSISWNRFIRSSKKMVSSDVLWKKLNSWYNLKTLDSLEMIPFKNNDEDFLLPTEIIPEHYQKHLSEEEKKNVDYSGTLKKYILVSEPDEDDPEMKSKLKGSEKMKWFECPQYFNKTVDKLSKKSDSETKLFVNESSNDSSNETPKVIRQYGKAGKVSSGSIMTLSMNSAFDELEDTIEDDTIKEESADTKSNAERTKLKRKRSHRRGDTPNTSVDESEISSPSKQARGSRGVDSTPTSNTRSRKASGASQEASSGTETEKESSVIDETSRNVRRYSQRVSDSKPPDLKRKSTSRR